MSIKRNPISEATVPRVHAVTLMIAVTLLLILFTYSWRDSPPYGTQTPTVRWNAIEDDDENFTLVVDAVDPNTAIIFKIEYALLNESGKTISGNNGDLKDILNLDFENEHTNISFQDKDGNGNITSGDVFLIKHVNHGGQAKEGYLLFLKFKPTGERMSNPNAKL